MYTKSFRGYPEQSETDIPVETFGDSFSAKAFLNSEKRYEEKVLSRREETAPPHDEPTAEQQINDQKDAVATAIDMSPQTKRKKTFGFEIDDLLLIGLVLLFWGDAENRDDMMIPILLGILLFFS